MARKGIYEGPGDYFVQWRFGYKNEWDAIQNEITNPDKDGTVTFDWLMEEILLKKRILESKRSIPDKDNYFVPQTAKTSLKSYNEIKYVNSEETKEYLVAKGYDNVQAIIYIKYGPFIVYLTDRDARFSWPSNKIGISPNWSWNESS